MANRDGEDGQTPLQKYLAKQRQSAQPTGAGDKSPPAAPSSTSGPAKESRFKAPPPATPAPPPTPATEIKFEPEFLKGQIQAAVKEGAVIKRLGAYMIDMSAV